MRWWFGGIWGSLCCHGENYSCTYLCTHNIPLTLCPKSQMMVSRCHQLRPHHLQTKDHFLILFATHWPLFSRGFINKLSSTEAAGTWWKTHPGFIWSAMVYQVHPSGDPRRSPSPQHSSRNGLTTMVEKLMNREKGADKSYQGLQRGWGNFFFNENTK